MTKAVTVGSVSKINDTWLQSCAEFRKKKVNLLQGQADSCVIHRVQCSWDGVAAHENFLTKQQLFGIYFKKLFCHSNSQD